MTRTAQLVSTILQMARNASFLQLAGVVTAIFFVHWLVQGIYQVYFHPLAGFPGPKFSAFTRLPYNIATWNGRKHEYVLALHDRYGDVVRVAPDELSFVDPDAWRDIHGHGRGLVKGAQGSVPPKHWKWYGKSSNGVANMLDTEDPVAHTHMRRIFSPAFSDRALKEQEPLFFKYVNQLVGNLARDLKQQPDTTFDMVKQYNYTTFDVMGDLTFGEPLHMLDESKYDPWVSAIFGSLKVMSWLGLLRHYPWLSGLVMSVFSSTIQKKKIEHFKHSADRVSKRLDRGRASEGRDLWDLVLKTDEAKQLSRDQMDSHATLFMVAGTETTATLLSGATYLLLKNPQTLQRLNSEIRDAFINASDMSMEALAALPYLNACLKEALRLYPPVALGLPHLTPSNGSDICGHFVPPNTTVSAPHFAMYRSARNFRNPHAFIPERWLGDAEFADDVKTALQPFSFGTRDCVGKNMAYHEMRLILANVLFRFDMELCPEARDWANQRTFIVWEKLPLPVRLKDVRA